MTNKQNTQFSRENTPNAVKLMESLRYSGYDNNIALADLVDNSLDANATNINIEINLDSKKDECIIIADDGLGMDEQTLGQALRLGSITHRNVESDLGRFGMGMVTASISIAKRIEVFTKQKDKPMLTSIMDLDEMAKNNNFNVYREKSTLEEIKFAKHYGLEDSGTVLVLRKCDKLTKQGVVEFADSLRKDIGETYRYFLRSGKKITVNGKWVEIVDPMWTDGSLTEEYKEKSEVFSDERYEIKIDGTDRKETFTVKIYILPKFDQVIMRKLKIGIKNQGFYILRNYRQISKADELGGIWNKDPHLNNIRAEIIFSGTLDSAMGINFTKHSIKPTQAVIDKLQNDIMPQIQTLATRNKKDTRRASAKELNFSEAERIISQKNKLLDKAEPDKKGKPTPINPVVKRQKTKVEEEIIKRGRPTLAHLARFESHSFGLTGPIFEAEKQGKITIIQWNIDHPFYERFLIEYKDNADLVNAVSFLAYSLGESKLKYSDDDTYEMLENIMSTISTNLRVLLS
ncbi:MAG: ATP-binding protein [bacterium]|nr:ATP-binding protein [bacterium]